MGRIVTLMTDFGSTDGYVGTMKGVILSIAPHTEIVDITHQIAPQGVLQGAVVLESAAGYFPPGAIHLAVVDPGVGSSRRAIAIQTPEATFIAPDNGLLSLVFWQRSRAGRDSIGQAPASPSRGEPRARMARLPAGCTGIRIDASRVGLPAVSSTFHGRDVFAPAAAHLALGIPPHRLGDSISHAARLSAPRATRSRDGTVRGHVVSIDHFGNLITDIEPTLLPAEPRVEVAGLTISGISRTYSDGPGLLALVGSTGRLEIAWRNGSAAERTGARVGSPVTITPGYES